MAAKVTRCWGSWRQFWRRNNKTSSQCRRRAWGAAVHAFGYSLRGRDESVGKIMSLQVLQCMQVMRLSVKCFVGDTSLHLSPSNEWPPLPELILHRHSVSGSSSFHFRDSVINFQSRRNREAVCRPLAAPRRPAHSSLGFRLRAMGRHPQRTNTGYPEAIVPASFDRPPTCVLIGLSFTRSLHKAGQHVVYW